MATEFIVNEDFAITIAAAGAWVPGPAAGHTYNKILTTKSKCGTKFILIGQFTWTAVGCALAGYVFTGGGGSIATTAQKVLCETQAPYRENDTGKCNGVFTNIFGPVGCSCQFTFTSAGQSKVRCK
jgi:hypothetical protein